MRAIEEEPHLFHEKDVKKLKESDTMINRFIADHANHKTNNYDYVSSLVIESLKWRKEAGINEIDLKLFPKELLNLEIFYWGQTGPKSYTVYLMGRRFRKMPKMAESMIKLGLFCAESKLNEFGDDIKISLFNDASDCGLAQVDMGLFMKAVPIYLKNYPGIIDHVYLYNVPWFVRPVFKLILAMIPATFSDLITNCTSSDYKEKIPMDKLPDYLGGSVKTNKIDPAQDAITIEQFADKSGLSKEELKQLKKVIDCVENQKAKEAKKC